MPISVLCACGKKLKAPDSAAGRVAKCPACGAMLDVPDPSYEIPVPVMEIEPVAVAAVSLLDVKPPARQIPAWARDPIVLVGVAVPCLVLILFVAFMAHRSSVNRDRTAILDRFSEADRLAYRGQVVEASEAYHAALKGLGRWEADELVRAAADDARKKVAAMQPEVRAAMAKREEAARVAAERAKADRARQDEEAKIADRSSLELEINGSVQIDKENGSVLRMPEIAVRLLPAKARYADFGETGALMAVGVKIETGVLPEVTELASVASAYSLLRDVGGGQSVDWLMNRFLEDKQWPEILARNTISKSITSSRGEFGFSRVPPGDYLIHAAIRVPTAQIEWLVPAKLNDRNLDFTLDTEHCAFLLFDKDRAGVVRQSRGRSR